MSLSYFYVIHVIDSLNKDRVKPVHGGAVVPPCVNILEKLRTLATRHLTLYMVDINMAGSRSV